MPPKVKKDTLVFILNIGVTKSGAEANPLLLKKTKSIVTRMIEHRIFIRPNDEVGIVLMGAADAEETGNIKEYAPIQIPSWEIVNEIQNLQNTNYCSHWIEAVETAVNTILSSQFDSSKRRIILISDFNEDSDTISEYNVDDVLTHLLDNNIQLHTIGEESFTDKPEDSLRPSESFLKNLFTKHVGQHKTFEEAELLFRYYEDNASKNPYPWYCTLDFIDKQIPIASYIRTTDTVKFPTWTRVKDNERLKNMTIYVDKQRRVYKRDEIVHGYKYGGTPVPFAMIEDNRDMVYKAGKKSYSIYSFANAEYVGLEYWCDSNTRVILPYNEAAEKPFYSLVQAMHNKNLVAIVRKVHTNNGMPKMVALFPCITVPEEPWCLVEIELPYAEDRREIVSRPMKSVMKHLSNEQNEMIDNLLESLTVTDEEDVGGINDCRFLPGAMHNPALQHKWHMLAYRALNPDVPVPEAADYLKNAFEAPIIKQKAKPYLEKIKQLFDLESVNPKAKEKIEGESKKDVNAGDSNKSDPKEDADDEAVFSNSVAEDSEFDVDVSKFVDYI